MLSFLHGKELKLITVQIQPKQIRQGNDDGYMPASIITDATITSSALAHPKAMKQIMAFDWRQQQQQQ